MAKLSRTMDGHARPTDATALLAWLNVAAAGPTADRVAPETPKRPSRWPTIRRMHQDGVRASDIARHLGISKEAVCQHLRRRGYEVRQPPKLEPVKIGPLGRVANEARNIEILLAYRAGECMRKAGRERRWGLSHGGLRRVIERYNGVDFREWEDLAGRPTWKENCYEERQSA